MIYRLSIYNPRGHEGYSYYSSRRDAERARSRLVDSGYDPEDLEITREPTPRTKKGVISLLEFWGSHPDNG